MPARQCLGDLRAYDTLLQKNGYWLHGSGYGYDYPMAEQDAGSPGAAPATPAAPANGAAEAGAYWHVRPGYEIRALMAAANVVAQRGQQHICESLLSTARAIYDGNRAAPRDQEAPKAADGTARLRRQIPVAQAADAFDATLRADQMMGTEVSNPSNQELGSVADIVVSPRTGKIAYLLIGRGGFFGIDQAYIPVPWKDFTTPPNTNLLVLDTSERAMDAAPRVKDGHYSAQGDYGDDNAAADRYWKSQLPR
jgi:sporulation protein YlmC with PRC-barrel domain